jgi:hypothetical protein
MKTLVNNKPEAVPTRSRLFLLAAATLLLAAAASAGDGKGNLGNPGVMPPQSRAFGKTYAEWGVENFKWYYSIPGPIHPALDTTGEFAAVGQQGKVWFLGNVLSGQVVRRVTIPAGTAIYLGIEGTSWATLPVDLDENGQPLLTEEEAFAVIKECEDTTRDLACEIDGKPVQNLQNYRRQTPAFSFTFPADIPQEEIMWNYGLPPESWLVPAGGWVSTPSMDDGTALMLAPLSVGEHTIHYTSYNACWDWFQDVTYYITVTGG